MAAVTRPFSTVTVFGGATFDRIARASARPVMGASNPGTLSHSPGGVGFNVATILARLGLATRLVTRLAGDADGGAVARAAGECGVHVVAPRPRKGDVTATYTATFDDAGGLIIGIADMAICDWIAPADAQAAIDDAPAGDFWIVDANLPSDTLAFIAGEAHHRGFPLAALTVSPAKATRIAPLLDRVAFLFANRLEAAVLLDRDPDVGAGARQAARYAAALAERFPLLAAVVTNGAEPLGSAFHGDVRAHTPLRARVRAVNGAGDSLAAGTIRGLAEGMALAEAVRFGLGAAALTLEAGGILEAAFTADAVAERMAGGSPSGSE